MITEQELLTKWRSLPQDKQQEVLKFVEFMQLKTTAKKCVLLRNLDITGFFSACTYLENRC